MSWFHPGLALLALRRTIDVPLSLWFALCVTLCIAQDWAPTNALLAADGDPLAARLTACGLTREGLWTGALLAAVPLLVWRSARTIALWRRGEFQWLGSRAVGRGTIVGSTWIGQTLGGLLLLTCACTLASVRGGTPGITLAAGASAGTLASDWITAGEPARCALDERAQRAPPGSRVRVSLATGVGSGPSAEVILTARRAGGAVPDGTASVGIHTRSRRARIAGRAQVEIELPPGTQPIELEVSTPAADARVFVVSPQVELWSVRGHAQSANVVFAAHIALALGAGLALALGLGAWLSPPSAAGAVLALWILGLLDTDVSAFLPGAQLPRALAIVAQGRTPAPVDARELAGCVLCCALGIALGALGLRHWARDT